ATTIDRLEWCSDDSLVQTPVATTTFTHTSQHRTTSKRQCRPPWWHCGRCFTTDTGDIVFSDSGDDPNRCPKKNIATSSNVNGSIWCYLSKYAQQQPSISHTSPLAI